jgi:uncharacterized protein
MALPHALKEAELSPLWVALTIGFLVQLFKFLASSLFERRLNFRRLVETGGMPSSHSASVAALSTAVGLRAGFDSVLFAVSVYFSLIVMYDAAGLRRAAGRHATMLNRLIDSHYQHDKRLVEMRLLELLGHTPFEVLVGAVVGVLFTLGWFALGGHRG